MIPALLGLLAPVAAVKAITQLARAAGAALRSTASPVTPPVPPAVETAHEVSPGSKNKYVVFTYDNLGQLVGVDLNGTATERYVFDDSGNLTSLTVGNTTTSFAANNLNQQTAPGTHVYDAKGQKTTLDGKTFEWDDQGRVTAIVQGTTRSEFAYDGLSRRTKITELTNGTVTSKKLYFWLGGSIVCERDGLQPGFPITKQYFGQGVLQGTTKLFYTFDHLGSIRELVDDAGVVQAAYRYSTYGERTKTSGNLDSSWGYAGLWHHEASGLDLATYRVYDAANKRWISRDPLGEGVDYNLYRYCGNNPVSELDPLGLQSGDGTSTDSAAMMIRFRDMLGGLSAENARRFGISLMEGWFFWEGLKPWGFVEREEAGAAAGAVKKCPSPNTLKKVKSLQKRLAEHEAKLAKYLANPEHYDNLGTLKNAASPEIRDRIIKGRASHLQREINNFRNQIRDLLE